MNITLSINEKTAKEARKVANEMSTSLNQLIRDHLELLTMRMESLEQRKLPIIDDDIEMCWKKHKSNVRRRADHLANQNVGASSVVNPETYWSG